MRRGRHYKAGFMAAVAVVIAGISMVVLFHAWSFDAEASGNLGTEPANPHNLSAGSTEVAAVSETRICIFCHTPHHADTSETLIGPLWNHTLSAASYDFSLIPATLIDTDTITVDGASKMCLGCHDGTVAVGAVGSGAIAMVTGGCLAGDAKIDPTCAVYMGTTPPHHIFSVPINSDLIADSITSCAEGATSTRLKYPWASPNANTDVYLRPTAQTYGGNPGVSGGEGTPAASSPPYSEDLDYGVQCSSCHNPHYYHKSGVLSCKFMTGGSCIDNYDPLCLACHAFDC